jgi:hypothetical protein
MATIGNQNSTRADVRVFEQGDWFADVSTDNGTRIPDGTRVDIVAGTVRLSGAIVRGGISGDVGRYEVAGRPEWDTPIKPVAYRSDAAVLLRTVLGDICKDALGPSWQSLVELPPLARLNTHYERPGTRSGVTYTARDVLALLDVPWYVRNDGVTVFAARESGIVSPSDSPLVPYRNDALGFRTVHTEDPGAFVPGKTFEGDVIGEVSYSITAENITTHLWTRNASNAWVDAFKTTLLRWFPRLFFQGVFSYTIAGPASLGRHDLKSAGSRWLPDIKLARFWTGAAGHRAALPMGTRVGVSFIDCDPAKPALVCVEPITGRTGGWNHAPDESLFYSNGTLDVDATVSVRLGGGTTPVVINSAALGAWFAAVQVATGVAPPAGITSTKAKA